MSELEQDTFDVPPEDKHREHGNCHHDGPTRSAFEARLFKIFSGELTFAESTDRLGMGPRMSKLLEVGCPLFRSVSLISRKGWGVNVLAAARPCRIEKLDTEAVIEANLGYISRQLTDAEMRDL